MAASLKKSKLIFVFWLLAVTASSCVLPAPSRQASTGLSQDYPFRPPTLSASALPTVAVTEPPVIPQSTEGTTAGEPTTTGPCEDRLAFVSDVTVPDGTTVAPSSPIDKRWQVENNGTCNWGTNYRLKLISGPEMGAKPNQALVPLRSGSQGEIRIQFTAPQAPGTYRSAWQAYNPGGQAFGDPIYIEVVVAEAAPATSPTP